MKFTSLLLFFLCSLSSFTQIDSTSILNFMVYDAKTGEPLVGARFQMCGTDGSKIDRVISDASEQKFILKKNEKYALTMSLNGYISASDEINTDIGCWSDITVYLKEYFLEPIEIICCHTIPEIYFDFNSHVITENSTESLGYFKELMVNNPDLRFELRGFISPKEHYSLSLQRASAVKSWLIENGIDENRLSLWWSSKKIKESQQKLEMSTAEAPDFQIVAITITKY